MLSVILRTFAAEGLGIRYIYNIYMYVYWIQYTHTYIYIVHNMYIHILYLILYYIILYYIMVYCYIVLYYILLYYITLYYITLHYIILYYIITINSFYSVFFWGYLEGNVWIYWLATNPELRCFLFLETAVVVVCGEINNLYIYIHIIRTCSSKGQQIGNLSFKIGYWDGVFTDGISPSTTGIRIGG